MNSLNKEQQKLVETNHNLIYSFAKSRQIDVEEYYDVLAIALCKAALVYDKSRGRFSTLAYKCMSNSYNQILIYQTTGKQIPENLIQPLDEVVYLSEEDGSEITLCDCIQKDIFPMPENTAIIHIAFDEVYNNKLTKQEQKVIKLLLQDKTQAEIGETIGVTRARICAIVSKIRKKWIEFIA